MRLPYAPSSPPPDSPVEEQGIYARITARRAPRPLLPLDLALLRAPPVADGWNSFLGAIRTGTTLAPALMELAICRVAFLNGAAFEWRSHCTLALKAGVSREVLERVKGETEGGEWLENDGEGWLSEEQRVVLAYTDAMTRKVRVEDGLFERVKGTFEERVVVELTATVAAYNCVSRFLVALDVAEMNHLPAEEWEIK